MDTAVADDDRRDQWWDPSGLSTRPTSCRLFLLTGVLMLRGDDLLVSAAAEIITTLDTFANFRQLFAN